MGKMMNTGILQDKDDIVVNKGIADGIGIGHGAQKQ